MDTDVQQLSPTASSQCRLLPQTTSANAQLRKIKKPLIEKRRRERINECLTQLKALVLEAMNKDGSQYNKMEKADILEMTVAHLKSVCGNGAAATSRPRSADSTVDGGTPAPSSVSASSAVRRYVSGYTECALEVANYLSAVGCSVDPSSSSSAVQQGRRSPHGGSEDVRRRLLEHLNLCLHRQTNHLASSGGAVEDRLAGGVVVGIDGGRTDVTFPPRCGVDFAASSSPVCRWSAGEDRDFVGGGSSSPTPELMDRLAFVDGYRMQPSAAPRSRCDSGVYSGASSPSTSNAGEEPTAASSLTVNGRTTHDDRCSSWPAAAASPTRFFANGNSPTTSMAMLCDAELGRLAEIASQQAYRVLESTTTRTAASSSPSSAAVADVVWRPW